LDWVSVNVFENCTFSDNNVINNGGCFYVDKYASLQINGSLFQKFFLFPLLFYFLKKKIKKNIK